MYWVESLNQTALNGVPFHFISLALLVGLTSYMSCIIKVSTGLLVEVLLGDALGAHELLATAKVAGGLFGASVGVECTTYNSNSSTGRM